MRDANSPIVRQPKMIEIAAKINDSTPSAILPFVAIKTLSLLKNIPEPIQIPTIIVMAVNNDKSGKELIRAVHYYCYSF